MMSVEFNEPVINSRLEQYKTVLLFLMLEYHIHLLIILNFLRTGMFLIYNRHN